MNRSSEVDDVNSFCGPLPNQAAAGNRSADYFQFVTLLTFADILDVPLGNADTRAG
jgi:hypothetical protein